MVFGYAYERLGTAERLLYRQLVHGLARGNTTLRLASPLGPERALKVLDCAYADRADLPWYRRANVLKLGSHAMTLELEGAAAPSRNDREAMRAVVETAIGPTRGMDEFGRLEHLYAWVARHVSYDEREEALLGRRATAHRAEGALLEGFAVCDGIARALQALLHAAGIAACFASGLGRSDDGTHGPHSWVVARVEGRWCHVDATWAAVASTPSAPFDYLCLSDAEASRSHTADPWPPMPPCEGVSDWYERKGFVLSEPDGEALRRMVQRQFAMGRDAVSLRVARGADFDGVARWVPRAIGGMTGRTSLLTSTDGDRRTVHVWPDSMRRR